MHHPAPSARPAAAPGDPAAVVALAPWRAWETPAARDEWDALATRAGTANPFFESWYLLPALRRFDPAGRVQFASLRGPEGLRGLVPLVRTGRYGRHRLPHLAVWLHANAFLGAPLIAAGHEAPFWRALLHHADARPGTALFLHLAAMPLDTPLALALHQVCAEQGRRVALVQREGRALLERGLSPEAYLAAALPGKKRKELRRQHARLAEQGRLDVVRRRDGDGLPDWLEAFLALEATGWKGRAGSALASAPETAGLFRDALTEAGARGRLERLSLELDGQPIAMLATFIGAQGAFSFKTAYDEVYARYSPGVQLQLANLALLDDPAIDWCDSCAAADHPMIDSLWTGRRNVGRLSVAIGGPLRRGLFDGLLALELARNPRGLA